MAVYDEIRKCVAFVGYKTELEGFRADGTGFFVNIQEQGLDFGYFVTAAHLIRGAQVPVFLRINRKDGNSSTEPTDKWYFHSNKRMDICAHPSRISPLDDNDPHDILFMNIASIAIREGQHASKLALGDEVFIASLFANRSGEKRNIPIFRSGNVAAMPEEPTVWPWSPRPAYLIETRSLGGTSGAPIYYDPSLHRQMGRQVAPILGVTQSDTGQSRRITLMPYLFVGMILSSHTTNHKADYLTEEEQKDARDSYFNAGISVAMTASDILDFLEGDPELKKQRSDIVAAKLKTVGNRLSSVSVRGDKPALSSASDQNPRHLEDFMSLLNAAAKTKPQDE